ncbi:hypothetical protein EVAR_36129_1 [Eumeta japonica]|uniref:Uncharacterized protein n=1 Tax=Eumeta variegata TaxID=151549 RepID=A0A4C1X5B6_EUMVA|nr:hypothetical protein EVAR_36129_1 [Eumeta japonica]
MKFISIEYGNSSGSLRGIDDWFPSDGRDTSSARYLVSRSAHCYSRETTKKAWAEPRIGAHIAAVRYPIHASAGPRKSDLSGPRRRPQFGTAARAQLIKGN